MGLSVSLPTLFLVSLTRDEAVAFGEIGKFLRYAATTEVKA